MLTTNEENHLRIDDTTKRHLLATVAWSKFLAILGFILIGVMLLGALVALFAAPILSSFSSELSEQMGATSTNQMFSILGGIGMTILFLVMLAFYFYPVYALMKFSKKIRLGIDNLDQDQLNEGFRYQKGLFRYLGIITLVVLGFYFLIFVFGGIATLIGLAL